MGVGIVDCEQPVNRELCTTHSVPPPPHRPVLRMWGRGAKGVDDRGEELFNANAIESHVALQIAEIAVRLSLRDFAREGGGAVAERRGSFEDASETNAPPPPGPSRPEFNWNGPQMRHKPLPWGGVQRPDVAMLAGR